jgi:GNAT superfamily N-acetyltransferase
MADMLVRLYDVPAVEDDLARLAERGVTIRRAMTYEKHRVIQWIDRTFSAGWASECETAFGRHPVSCFIAVEAGQLIGFAGYDCTCRNFFGPTGVAESSRGQGVGTALLLACLHAMADEGYAYAIIGGVGPTDFYARAVDAIEIPGSTPGIYPPNLHDES